MNKLDYLINYLLNERSEKVVVPTDIEEKKKLYKALCNIREPKEISQAYIEIENEYLQEELKKKEVVVIDDIKHLTDVDSNIKNKDKLYLWQGDITRLKIDAIVNPANSQGLGCFNPSHVCLDNIIGIAAGVCLRLECNEIMKKKDYYLETGQAIITRGYNLPSNYIIHTVGPIIDYQVTELQKRQLAECYNSCLDLAKEYNIRTIAFPCISTGLFHFPKDLAAKIAIQTVDDYLDRNREYFDKIIFCVFSNEDYHAYQNNKRSIF